MNEMKYTLRLQRNEQAMERWLRKLLRAANEVASLRQENRRLKKPKPPAPEPEVPSSPPPPPSPADTHVDTTPGDDGGIPTFLRRGRAAQAAVDLKVNEVELAIAAGKAKDAKASEAIEAEIEAAKKKRADASRARSKLKTTAMLQVRRAMPLSGKAALAKINASD